MHVSLRPALNPKLNIKLYVYKFLSMNEYIERQNFKNKKSLH